MSYIVGICGTHGTGKSTIIKGVKAAGYPVVETSIAREAQKALGWAVLSEAEKSVDNMWALQNAILHAMFLRDQTIHKSGMITVVERTPADVWAYTAMWCRRLNIDSLTDFTASMYKARCQSMAREYRLFLQVPMSDAVPFVEEPNRADLPSRLFVALSIDNFIWSGAWPTIKIKSTTPEERVAEALATLQ